MSRELPPLRPYARLIETAMFEAEQHVSSSAGRRHRRQPVTRSEHELHRWLDAVLLAVTRPRGSERLDRAA